MKIAFVTLMGGQPFGGSEVLWTKTAKLSIEQGHEVYISGYDWGSETHPVYKALKSSGANVALRPRFLDDLPPVKKFRSYIENRNPKLKKDWKFLKTFRPDHVLINQGGCFDLIQHHFELYELLTKLNIPYSLLCHNHPQFSFLPDSNIVVKAKPAFQNAVNNFFISSTQQKFVEKTLLTELNNAHFTWNPLNVSSTGLIPWPANGTLQFALVAALISGKGQDVIFSILASSPWKERDWQLNVYGKGYGESYLKELAEQLGITDRVFFHGHVQDITEIWKKNHILLQPSSGEGLPISMMEALVSGRPVISTDVGGVREIIIENETGFLSEGPTTYSFSGAMERAFMNKSNWKQMGENAHTKYSKEFSVSPEKKLLEKIEK